MNKVARIMSADDVGKCIKSMTIDDKIAVGEKIPGCVDHLLRTLFLGVFEFVLGCIVYGIYKEDSVSILKVGLLSTMLLGYTGIIIGTSDILSARIFKFFESSHDYCDSTGSLINWFEHNPSELYLLHPYCIFDGDNASYQF